MLINYLKTTLRNLFKAKTYGVLNLFGLAIGLTCASMIFLWVEDELNFNHNFSKRDRLYQIYENQTYEGKTSTFIATPGLMAKSILTEIPGIKNAARAGGLGNQLFTLGDKVINEQGEYVDSAFLSLIDIPFIYGGATNAFKQLHSIVISEKLSKKFFDNANPVGKTLRINNEQDFTIAGVFRDLPNNSTFQFQWLAPIENIDHKWPWMQVWDANWAHTYVEVDQNADINAINKKLANYLSTKATTTTQCFLFSMNDWNLRNNFVDGKQSGGRIQYVRLFSYVAWIILLIACVNFMNLSTARSEQRAKEVGLRKVVGATKRQLIGQFIAEAVIMSFAGVVIAVGISYFLLPSFNTLVEKQLSLDIFSSTHLVYLAVIGLSTGLIAGSYPAFYLSSFSPNTVLKKMHAQAGGAAVLIRKGLVVTQFSISIFIMIATVIIYRQIQHVKNRELGYNKNNLVYMEIDEKTPQRFNSLYADLKATGVVEYAALSDQPVLQIGTNTDNFSWHGKNASQNPLVSWESVSSDFFATMNIKVLKGRNFYNDENSDSNSVIINESMAKQMREEGRVGGTITDGNKRSLTIVGIVSSFVYNNMYETGGPLVLFHGHKGTRYLNIRIDPNTSLATAIGRIEKVIKSNNPAYPVDLKFVDADFNKLFKTESLTGKLAGLFAALSIIISCFGLFGLSAHTAQRRVREIGIRKVLGASVVRLTNLLCKDFLLLVIISFVIAFPLAWWALNNWLQGYAYRTNISWWVFALPGAFTIVISMMTVSLEAIKSATTNPVKTIR